MAGSSPASDEPKEPQRSGACAAAAALDAIERLGRLDGWIGAACLVTLTLLMLAEITVRALSNFISWVPADIPVAWEYSSYLMAACFTFGAAMTLRAGGHIRVTLVLGRLAPPARRLLEIAASLVATLFVGFLAIAMARFAWTRVRARADLDLQRHHAVDSRSRDRLRHGAARAAIPRALHPGAARPAAGRSSHQGGAGRIRWAPSPARCSRSCSRRSPGASGSG